MRVSRLINLKNMKKRSWHDAIFTVFFTMINDKTSYCLRELFKLSYDEYEFKFKNISVLWLYDITVYIDIWEISKIHVSIIYDCSSISNWHIRLFDSIVSHFRFHSYCLLSNLAQLKYSEYWMYLIFSSQKLLEEDLSNSIQL